MKKKQIPIKGMFFYFFKSAENRDQKISDRQSNNLDVKGDAILSQQTDN